MKSAWQGSIVDWAAINSGIIEEVHVNEYTDLLHVEIILLRVKRR